MINKKYSVATITLSLILLGCSSLKAQTSEDSHLNEIYEIAQKKLQQGNWKQAIMQLERLESCYPFGSYAQQVQLDLIYAYYKNDDFLLAQVSADRFIRLNPIHPNIDYVIYMHGLISMAMDDNPLQRFFGIDRSDRNPQHARNAFTSFSRLVHDYPDSQYVADATKRLIFLKNRLAKYEYLIADYYTRRGAWIAVINRVEGMLRDYPDTQATRDGLKLMENAYRQMQITTQANKVKRLIVINE